jgi:hypothetical protein
MAICQRRDRGIKSNSLMEVAWVEERGLDGQVRGIVVSRAGIPQSDQIVEVVTESGGVVARTRSDGSFELRIGEPRIQRIEIGSRPARAISVRLDAGGGIFLLLRIM